MRSRRIVPVLLPAIAAAMAAFLSAALPGRPAAAAERCTVPSFSAFVTDACPWDEPSFRRAMEIVEAARWRCPRLDAYEENSFLYLSRAAALTVSEAEHESIRARDCADGMVAAAFDAVERLLDETLFIHFEAALMLHDEGLASVVAETRLAWIGAVRDERDRLAGLVRSLPELRARAVTLAAIARDDARVRHGLSAQIVFWTAPYIAEAEGRGGHMRASRHGYWTGHRPLNVPQDVAVSSATLRLSSEGYPPGARYGWHTDAVHLKLGILREREVAVDPCPQCRVHDPIRFQRPRMVHVDIGFQPVGTRTLRPVAVTVRLGGASWYSAAPVQLALDRRALRAADFHGDAIHRFFLEGDMIDAMLAAGDDAEIGFEVEFEDEQGGSVSSDAVLDIASGNCAENCAPRLPLRGFADTFHWASEGVPG